VHRPDDLAGPTRYHKWLFRNWRAGYDLAALAEIGDFVSVMTYSQHTRRTPPGPQAGVPWVEDVVEYFLQHMPAEKLSLGIPTGSQHWYTSQEDRIQPEMARSYSENVPWDRAVALVERYGAELIWSEEQQVPYAFYERGGTFEWIFLENARSFEAKLGLVGKHGLRGFSVWVLGSEDPGIWSSL
jgi:spore germination protein YaaH